MRHTRRRAFVTRFASVLAALALALTALPAAAEHFENVREVVAEDGVAAAAAWSKLAFPDGADSVLLGRADLFADSLASGSLQDDEPLLLSNSSSISQPTLDEIDRLQARSITILGGTSAISAGAEQELRDRGYSTRRLSGASRIETAVAVARAGKGLRTAFLARAFGTDDPTAAFADALSVGAWAAETGRPVLLTETQRLSPATAAYLQENVDEVLVIGGTAAVSDATMAQIQAVGASARRISGPNRFATAIAIAGQRGFQTASQAQEVVLVDGQGANGWTDGFTAAAYAGRNKTPIVLANSVGSALPEPTLTFLQGGGAAKLLTGWTVPSAQVDQAAQAMGQTVGITRVMQVRLGGRNVVRPDDDGDKPIWGYGDDTATGMLTMTVDEEKGTIAYTYESDLDSRPASNNALVLRRGKLDERGPVVVSFPAPGDDHRGSGEVDAEDFIEDFSLAELIASPADYYAEVATRSDDEGALRGQLPSGGESHLPIKPALQRLESKGGDTWVTLHFTAPVFSSGAGLSPEDFEVTVGDGLAALVISGGVDVADTASEARTTVTLKLNRPAVKDKTTSVRMESSAASELINNLGEHPASATVSERTPEDTVAPVFEAIEVVIGVSAVTVVFSEPVHTGGTNIAPNITVGGIANGTPFTRSVSGSVIWLLTERATRQEIKLTEPLPSAAEVRLTFADAAANAIKDGAGVALSKAVLSRTATSRAGGTSLENLTASDLVRGGGRFDPSRNQDLIVTTRVAGALAGKPIFLVLPPKETAYTGISLDRAWGELIWDNGSKFFTDNDLKDGVFNLPSTTTIPDGASLTIAVRDVAVTRTTTGTFELRVGRGDTNATFPVPLKVLNGVEVLSYGSLPAGVTTSTTQQFSFKVRGALASTDTSTGLVHIDLSRLVSAGVDYSAATLGAPGTGTTRWVGNPRTAVQFLAPPPPSTGIADGGTVTFSVTGVKTPSAEAYNVPVSFRRPNESGMATLQQVHHVMAKTLLSAADPAAPTITDASAWPVTTAAATTRELTTSVTAHGELLAGQKVRVNLRHSLLPCPSAVTNGTLGTVSGTCSSWGPNPGGNKLVLAPASNSAGLSHTQSLAVGATVDNRDSGRTFLVEVSRSDQPRMRWTLPVTISALASPREVPVRHVQGSSTWANTGDFVVLWFHGPITALTGSIIVQEPNAGAPSNATISCTAAGVSCTYGTSTESRLRQVRMQLTAPAGTPVPALQGRKVTAVNFTALDVANSTSTNADKVLVQGTAFASPAENNPEPLPPP